MQICQILFIELLGGIGDVLIALPAIHALGRSHPEAELTVLTFAPGGELLETDPWIQRVVYAPNGQAKQAVEQLLTANRFDLIVSDTNYDQIPEVIERYKQQSSYTATTITNLWQSPPIDERVSDRFLHILFTAELLHSDESEDEPQLYLTEAEQVNARQRLGAAYRPLIILCPDAGMSIKRWPIDNFVAVGKALQQQYGATILVPVGSDLDQSIQLVELLRSGRYPPKRSDHADHADHADCLDYVRDFEDSVLLWPRGPLRQIAAMLAQADLMIAADTGLARISAALKVPTITLFGPSWHERYGQPAPHINLQGYPDCPERMIRNFTEQPCWYSGHCPFPWQTCLEDITPTAVLEAAQALLLTQPASIDHRTARHSGRNGLIGTSSAGRSSLPESPAMPPAPVPISPSVWRSVRNLLVMRLDNIGDVIMTSPVLSSLRDNLPTAKITLMTSGSGALTTPLLPWIDAVLPWRVLWQDLGRLSFDPNREWELIETLRRYQFDAVIILTSFSQSPHPAGLICALAGIPLRLGESKEQDLGTLTDTAPVVPEHIHQVDRNLHLIESVGFFVRNRRLQITIPDQAYDSVREILQISTAEFPPYLLLNPWTSCQSRNYDPEKFAIAARELSKLTGWPVIVTGVEKDRSQVQPLLTLLQEQAINLVGTTNLTELAALVARAKLVLTNNTSVMHIADATDTPSLILFSGTEQESQWQPRHSRSRLLQRPTVCSPCYQFICPYELQCLKVSPEQVVAAGLALLDQPVSPALALSCHDPQ